MALSHEKIKCVVDSLRIIADLLEKYGDIQRTLKAIRSIAKSIEIASMKAEIKCVDNSDYGPEDLRDDWPHALSVLREAA